jgi:hypothetical protein
VATSEFSVADLATAMDKATDDIKREVGQLIERAAIATRDRVQQRYPVGPTGTLKRRVTLGTPRNFVTTETGVALPARTVLATAPHVHIWQEGTVERFDATRANARRGRSPRHGRVFQAVAADERGQMLKQAEDLLIRNREL